MKKLIMLYGLPASGKSTWARQHIVTHQNVIRVNNDDLRMMLHNGKFTRGNEKQISQLRFTIIRSNLEAGRSVIVDDTNLHPKHETTYRDLAKEYNARFEIKTFDIDLQEAIDRDRLRDKPVGAKIIRKMYNRYLRPKPEPIVYDRELPYVIICDLDGTLAILNGERSPYDGKSCNVDLPNHPVIETLQRYSPNTTIIIFSGRNDNSKVETIDWLGKYDVYYDFLHMRPDGDFRSDVILKEEMYRTHIEGKYNVRFVLDDRTSVVKLWRSLGMSCFQVAEGDF